MSKKVAVITINYNQPEMTAECVRSILNSDYPEFQIFLVDNGSSEDNLGYFKEKLGAEITLLSIKNNVGYVGGVNHGMKNAAKISPSYYLIMNNDTIIDSCAIRELVSAADRHGNECIVTGKVYDFYNQHLLQSVGQKSKNKKRFWYTPLVNNDEDNGQFDHEMEMDMIDDVFWLVPKEVFEKVGLYSEYFFLYGEQNDYAFRAVRNGFKLLFTPAAKLWHKGGITTSGGNKSSPRITYWKQKASLKLALLYLDKISYLKYYLRYVAKLVVLYPLKNAGEYLRNDAFIRNTHRAYFLALMHFTLWSFHKTRDNGYNPFAKG